MNILDFIPKYPNIDKVKSPSYFNPYSTNFYESIFKKEEFYGEKVPEIEEFPEEKGEYLKAQKIISRYFSSFTKYKGVLLFWAMGAGKTSAAIASIEKIKNENSSLDKALIYAKGEGLLKNFLNELVFNATKGQYIPDNYEIMSEIDKQNVRLKKKTSDFYEFNTFQITAKKLSEMSNEQIRKEYSNKIIVIDEVHNIRFKGNFADSIPDLYTQFYRLCHIPDNIKILLLSGTPMKDKPEEIAGIMNLILPVKDNLPFRKQFNQEYLKDNNLTDNPIKIDELKQSFKGRVSYLNSIDSIVPKVFVGEIIIDKGFKHFVIDEDFMSDFQSKAYKEAYEKDTASESKDVDMDDSEITKGIYNNAVQSILFVFPDGSYGETGFNKYITTTGNRYTMKKTLINALKGKDDAESLEKLRKYSSKYAASIETLLKNYKEGKSGFVYNEYVKGSGLILFGLILSNVFGFKKTGGKDTSSSNTPRYSILTGNESARRINEIVKTFNKPENMNGKIISVILGSRLISEGYSFKNVQSEDIHTPFWNYSETAQVIGRGYRFGSHKDLIEAGQKPKLFVYQRASITDDEYKTPSLDIIRYKRSENKDVVIKQFERLLKESAFDCALTYDRNIVRNPAKNGSRECDYQNCLYLCDGIDMDDTVLSPEQIDYITNNIYYLNDRIDQTIERIKLLFRTEFSYNYITIKILLDDIDDFTLLSSLEKVISNSIPIKNKYGFICYLKERNDNYFLVESLNLKENTVSVFYTKYPTIFDNKSYEDIIVEFNIKEYNEGIANIFSPSTDESLEQKLYIKQIISILPFDAQQYILENVLLAQYTDSNICNTFTTDTITEIYNQNIFEKDGQLYHNFNNKTRCLKDGVWQNCSFNPEELIAESKSDVNTDFGFIGLYEDGKFKIKRILKNVKSEKFDSSGIDCTSLPRIVLAYIIVKVNNEPTTDDVKIDFENLSESEIDNIIKGENITKLVVFSSDEVIGEKDITKDMEDKFYDNLTLTEKRNMVSWLKRKGGKKNLCGYIQELFKENNMIQI